MGYSPSVGRGGRRRPRERKDADGQHSQLFQPHSKQWSVEDATPPPT